MFVIFVYFLTQIRTALTGMTHLLMDYGLEFGICNSKKKIFDIDDH